MYFLYCYSINAQQKNGNTVFKYTADSLTMAQVLWQISNGFADDSTSFKYSLYCKPGVADHVDTVYFEHAAPLAVNDQSFLKVHGNILYNFLYRSFIDTPFAQSDLMQHQVQTNLIFLVKNKYPVKMTITNRNSNSPYFSNYTDVNVQFNQQQLLNNLKADFIQQAIANINGNDILNAERNVVNLRTAYQQLQLYINNPAVLQHLVEEKERGLINNAKAEIAEAVSGSDSTQINPVTVNKDFNLKTLPGIENVVSISNKEKAPSKDQLINKGIDSLSQKLKDKQQTLTPSIEDSSFADKYNHRKQKLDDLFKKIKKAEESLRLSKNKSKDSVEKIKSDINKIASVDSLYDYMKRNNIPKDSLTKAQRILLSINQVGIGRSWVDYSELTVKNISLTGANIELNPGKLYLAAAAGKVNYRYRDFIFKNNTGTPSQHLWLLRGGVGKKDGTGIIATLYSGTKAPFTSLPGDTLFRTKSQKVIGISIEAKFFLNKNNYIVAEIAKSSYNSNAAAQPINSELFKKIFNLSTRTNEAYSIKLFSQLPLTNTKINGYYKKIGEHFQSFNLYPTNVNQDAWLLRVNQSWWKNRLTMDGAVRKNDFASPVAVPSAYSSKTIFKSVQLTMRIPKYPFISLGYYPSSQLTIGNGDVITENQYNTLNALMSYNYSVSRIAMNSNAMFTKFYNSSSDTGFIYFNASNFSFSHSIFLQPISFQSSVGITKQKQVNLFTLEQQATLQLGKNISVTGGAKWNRLNHQQTLWGADAVMSMNLINLGTIQLNYDKSYIPASNRTLMPVNMGRLSFYRIF